MKKPIVLTIMMIVSFVLSSAVFFSSGFYDFTSRQATFENANKIAIELEIFPFINIGNSYNRSDIKEINETRLFSLEGIKEIEIDSVNTEIIVRPTFSNNISFNLVGIGLPNSIIRVDNKADKLEVRVKYKERLFDIGIKNLILYVDIPENYSGDLSIKTVLAEIDVSDLNLKNYNTDSISGEVYSENINAETCDFDSTSGSVVLAKVSCEDSNIETISGEVKINNGILGDIETISGKIYANNVEVNRDVTLKTISGKIELKQKEVREQKVIFNSVSGREEGVNPLISSPHTIHIKTTSGNLKVF